MDLNNLKERYRVMSVNFILMDNNEIEFDYKKLYSPGTNPLILIAIWNQTNNDSLRIVTDGDDYWLATYTITPYSWCSSGLSDKISLSEDDKEWLCNAVREIT